MKDLSLIILTLFIAVCSSCDSGGNEPEPSNDYEDDHIILKLVSKNTFDYPIKVIPPTILSVELVENNDVMFYVFGYTIDLKNTGSTPLDFLNPAVGAYLVTDHDIVGAAGSKIADIHIDPKGTFKITYEANSGSLPDPTDIDGLTLQIKVYQNNNPDDIIVLLEYLITLKV